MKKTFKKMFAGYAMALKARGGKKAVAKYLSGCGLLCGGLYLLLKGDQEMTSCILSDFFEKSAAHLDPDNLQLLDDSMEEELKKVTDEWG